MNKNIILGLAVSLLGFSNSIEAQKIKNYALQNAIKEISKLNVYETTCTVGYANTPSSQYERFTILATLATDKELITLAEKHKNPVVRLYSYQALKKKNVEIPTSLIAKFKSDRDAVISLQGCLAENTTVNKLSNEIFVTTSKYNFTKE